MNRIKSLKIAAYFGISLFVMSFTGCYSVFSGGTGGKIVDAESTTTPKSGIANVDVYAYLNEGDRNRDYGNWREGTVFSPGASYYGHTSTSSDGSFTISKLVWKEYNPDFGKDADFTNVFLLFYHENYGLTKGQTVIISDSFSDTVYAELKAVKKTTLLNFKFEDVSTRRNATQPVIVKVSVPQTTDANQTIAPKIYESTITGTGSISVSYPRYQNDSDRQNNIETTPDVTITYRQSADRITWKACYNEDNAASDFSFRSDAETGITKRIGNQFYDVTFYGKPTKMDIPSINGQYISSGTSSSADDGVVVSLKQKDNSGSYNIDLGQVTTGSQPIGTNGTEKHGVFSGLGNGYSWIDESYTGRFSTVDVRVSAGSKQKDITLRSDGSTTYTVQLQ